MVHSYKGVVMTKVAYNYLTEDEFFVLVEKTFNEKWVSSVLIKKEEPKIRKPDSKPITSMHLFTETNQYIITIKPPIVPENITGYLGCIAVSRKERAGEDWKRGNDLADGPFTEHTWNRILRDIVMYELVKIHKSEERKVFYIETDKEISKTDINKIVKKFKKSKEPLTK